MDEPRYCSDCGCEMDTEGDGYWWCDVCDTHFDEDFDDDLCDDWDIDDEEEC